MLTLVRHAATEWSGIRYCGRTDAPLSDAGREQVAPLVAYLSAVTQRHTTVLTSPARRCRDTASPIAAALQGELLVDDRLREIDFGDAEKLTFAEIEARWPSLAAALAAGETGIDWPGGERCGDFTERVQAVWADLSRNATDVVIVTHGGPLRAMLDIACPSRPSTPPLHIAPADVVRLVGDEAWAVDAVWSARDGAQPWPS